jgi:uncharacterized protein (DUF1810 family)
MEHQVDLSRFTEAHQRSYPHALQEIQSRRVTSAWMWYVFPHIHGLGRSFISQYYAIQNLDEATAFLRDSYLGGNLIEISSALLGLPTDNPTEVFGFPNDRKLQSSMTLFAIISEEGSVFHQVLYKFFGGEPDRRTLKILDCSYPFPRAHQ